MTKVDKRSSFHDFIDDIIEVPSSSLSYNSTYSRFKDDSKLFQNRNQSTISSSFDRSKYEQIDNLMLKVKDDFRDRGTMTVTYSNQSTNTNSNDERRKEIDFIINNLNDGKVSSVTDDRTVSDGSDQSLHLLTRTPITTTTTPIMKNDDGRKNNIEQIDLVPFDGDILTLQRELQEKELDIIHLHKEIQELQLENKLLKAKVPNVYSNGYASNNSEVEAFRREKEILQNELHASQELIAKLQQQQQHQNVVVSRSNKIDDIAIQQKDALEKKLRIYEKQMRTLTDENDRLKQNLQQFERTITQYKKEKEELKLKVNEAKKRNDDLFYQEFHSLRNDLKMIKQRNNELFEENIRLLQEKRGLHWHPSNQEQSQKQQIPSTSSSSPPTKQTNLDSKHLKNNRSESPNMSEASDSTNYLATVSIERYHPRSSTGTSRSITIDGNNYSRSKRYSSLLLQEDLSRMNYLTPSFNTVDQSFNFRSSKVQRPTEWNDETIQNKNEDIIQYDDEVSSVDNAKPSSSHMYTSNYSIHRNPTSKEFHNQSQRSMSLHTKNHSEDRQQNRKNGENIIPRRPFAPSSINDMHVHDLVKFSRPGGKISKGLVKYVGTLPGKNDQYLGLELEDEETKHDGVYQDKRLFQCKPNKGIFIAFNKVIMAWSGT